MVNMATGKNKEAACMMYMYADMAKEHSLLLDLPGDDMEYSDEEARTFPFL